MTTLTIAIIFIVLLVAAFVGGALVYRNNAKKAEALAVQLQKTINDLEAGSKK